MDQVRILGPVEIVVGDRVVGVRDFEGAKPREVLCLLAAHSGRPVQKESLAAALWDGEPPASWVSTLEGYVSLLRRALQPGGRVRESVVLTQRGCYLLDGHRVQIDLSRFDDLVVQADGLHDGAALPVLRDALRLVRGPLMESERSNTWVERARTRHSERVRRASIRAARLALAGGHLDEALRFAEGVVDSDPLCEDAWRVAIEVHWRSGRRAEALRAVERLRGNLASTLGIGASPTIERLHLEILRDESGDAVA